MAKLVTGFFKARSSAMLAIEDLTRHNVPQEDISILMTDTATGREFFAEVKNKAPEYGVVGTIIGGIIGGILFTLIAQGYITDNVLNLTGMALPLAILAGVGAGMLAGLLIGAMFGSAIPEYEVDLHTVGDKDSGYMVGVYVHPRREFEVRKLMEAAGAKHLRVKAIRERALKVYGQRDYASASPGSRSGISGDDRAI